MRNMKESNNFEDVGVGGSIILK